MRMSGQVYSFLAGVDGLGLLSDSLIDAATREVIPHGARA